MMGETRKKYEENLGQKKKYKKDEKYSRNQKETISEKGWMSKGRSMGGAVVDRILRGNERGFRFLKRRGKNWKNKSLV